MMRTIWTVALAAIVVAIAPKTHAASDIQDLNWKDLVPPVTASQPQKPKTFFSGSAPAAQQGDAAGAAPPPIAEGKFMQMKRHQPGGDKPPAVIAELSGKRVRIGGYVVPLDFEATSVKEFLLVPFVGACIHVPPPPSNQIIYVKLAKGFDVTGSFDPVTVTGTIKTDTAFTGLADAGYSMDAESVEFRKE